MIKLQVNKAALFGLGVIILIIILLSLSGCGASRENFADGVSLSILVGEQESLIIGPDNVNGTVNTDAQNLTRMAV